MRLTTVFVVVVLVALFLPGYLAKRDAAVMTVTCSEADGRIVKGCR